MSMPNTIAHAIAKSNSASYDSTGYSSEVSNIREIRLQRLLELLDEHKGVKKALAATIGKAPAQVSQWVSGVRTITEESAREIEKMARKPLGWMDMQPSEHVLSVEEQSPPIYLNKPPLNTQSGTDSFIQKIKIFQDEKYFTWESFLHNLNSLPKRFTLEMPDDAMGPSTPKGTVLVCETGSAAIIGHGVVVRDRHGDIHVRRYVQGVGGRWTAQAASAAYASLTLEEDALEIIAIVKGKMLDGSM